MPYAIQELDDFMNNRAIACTPESQRAAREHINELESALATERAARVAAEAERSEVNADRNEVVNRIMEPLERLRETHPDIWHEGEYFVDAARRAIEGKVAAESALAEARKELDEARGLLAVVGMGVLPCNVLLTGQWSLGVQGYAHVQHWGAIRSALPSHDTMYPSLTAALTAARDALVTAGLATDEVRT